MENEKLNSELERLRKENDKLKDKLNKSERFREAFIDNMSYEIRTPMNGIIGFSEMLSDPYLSDDERKFYSDIIVESSNLLLSILTDILDLTKIESGQLKIENSEFDLNEELLNLYHIYKKQTDKKKLQLILENIITEELIIEADKIKILKILRNLIDNAIKYTNKGWVKFKYTISNNQITFMVQDTGIGIAKHDQKGIFERFNRDYMAHSKNFGGSGLGLAVCKNLVGLLGGSLKMESKIGEGSRFFFTIPIKVIRSFYSID